MSERRNVVPELTIRIASSIRVCFIVLFLSTALIGAMPLTCSFYSPAQVIFAD
jgi:hypothetical protein